MTIYIYMIFFFIVFYMINKMVYNEIVEKILLFLMFIMMLGVSALRKHVGTDYGVYLNVYRNIDDRVYDGEGMEIGYFYLNKIVKDLFGGEYAIFVVTSIIIIGLTYIIIKKYSVDPLLSMILFLCIGNYIASFNIIRQSIAISLIFYSYKHCDKKLIWIIPILISSLFHKTALMVIPLYLIAKLNLKREHYYIILTIGLLLFLSYGKTVAYLTNFIEAYEGYENSKFVMEGANPIRTLVSIFILVFCFIGYDEIIKDKKMRFAFAMVLFGTIFSLFMMKGKIFSRVVSYFDVFNLILIPYVINNIKQYEMKKYKLFIISTIVACNSLYFYYTVKTNQADIVPYKTYIYENQEFIL